MNHSDAERVSETTQEDLKPQGFTLGDITGAADRLGVSADDLTKAVFDGHQTWCRTHVYEARDSWCQRRTEVSQHVVILADDFDGPMVTLDHRQLTRKEARALAIALLEAAQILEQE
jgi:hypothetical protein